MKPLSTEQILELAALLKERVGLNVRADGHGALRIALLARLEEEAPPAADGESYLALLRSPCGDEELRKLLPLVTVGKTRFFRDERQFTALGRLLPELLARVRGGGKPVSIWSAGCATGEEPYSIAMVAAEGGAREGEVEVVATDVNPEAVAFATKGAYEARRVKEVPAPLLARYFDWDGELHLVKKRLRGLLGSVRPHNLISSTFPRPADGGTFDVIFCRNVIIYFDTPTTQGVLSQFHSLLSPGGYLFLGYSESLFRLFLGFELTEVGGAFLYRRPEGADPVVAASPPSGRPHLVPMPPATPPVRHLKLDGDVGPGGKGGFGEGAKVPLPDPPLAPREYLDAAVALFADGRFEAARELLERLLEQGGGGLGVWLTLANLYGVLRQLEKARHCYEAALSQEPLSAEAHLFYGVHLLSCGGGEEAARELSRALFLDPDLALAHYYLGRCREAQRDLERARLSYRNVLEAYRRRPEGRRQSFLGYYPDLPEDGGAFARAAEYALLAL